MVHDTYTKQISELRLYSISRMYTGSGEMFLGPAGEYVRTPPQGPMKVSSKLLTGLGFRV